MKKTLLAACAAAIVAVALPVSAQNITIVNGKAVPKARADLLLDQIAKSGQPKSPELESRVKDEVVLREIFMQEAERRGIPASADYKAQMELARQSILIRELFTGYAKTNPVTDAEAKAEYEKFKAEAQTQGKSTEYRARHILVDKEDEAKALIAQIKGGAKFDELASKNSKDTGSAANGGDLGWSAPDAYVKEFSEAMLALKPGQTTDAPVKSQFGFHIIRLEETRAAQFPAFDDVKDQIKQRLSQEKLAKYQEDLKKKAKTDYKFSN
ncbi:peptidylprolyl isomerase [Roseateles sp. BYS180W]|uniref:peptidylprolyl isomerase n=1 Tax=Roseateles rivi TaxID=3299028 RepID=A0ABW7FVY8_9BURK